MHTKIIQDIFYEHTCNDDGNERDDDDDDAAIDHYELKRWLNQVYFKMMPLNLWHTFTPTTKYTDRLTYLHNIHTYIFFISTILFNLNVNVIKS